MRVAYVHGFAGVTGAGLLGALLDAGAPFAAVEEGWARLRLPPLAGALTRVQLADYAATCLTPALPNPAALFAAQTFSDFMAHVEDSGVPPVVRHRFRQLLDHFTAALTRINAGQEQVDVCRTPCLPAVLYMGSGVLLALDALAVEQLLSAPVNLGPGPQPLAAALLRNVPVYGDPTPEVRTTADGAAILAGIATRFGPMPAMTLATTGYGAVAESTVGTPHGIQVLLGETAEPPAAERLAVLETNIDDMNPEFYEVVFERLFAAGALDVTLTPLLMKKGRPANTLTVLAPLPVVSSLSRLVLQETSTFGVRIYEVWRQKLGRFFRNVDTCYGPIPIKCGVLDDRIVQAAPEYDACKHAALAHGVPVRVVYSEAARLATPWVVTGSRHEEGAPGTNWTSYHADLGEPVSEDR